MRKIILVSTAVLFSSVLLSQTYIGLRGGIASTWLINKNISDAGDELDYNGSAGGNFGLHAVQMLGSQSGIGVYVGSRSLNQELNNNSDKANPILSEIKLKYTDIGLHYTYMAEGGLFIEVGPQFSLREDVITEIADKGGDFELEVPYNDVDINSSTIFAVIGIGGMINITDNLKVSPALRFGYGITDLTNELTLDEYNDAVSPSSLTVMANGYDISDEEVETLDYKATHPAYASFNVGIYYVIGGE